MTSGTKFDLSNLANLQKALPNDVYFREDFIRIHALADDIDILSRPGFTHASAVRNIPQTDWSDLETPHGYGGPVAIDLTALQEGISDWRQRQRDVGRVAEFIRLHPFVDTDQLRPLVDFLLANWPLSSAQRG